MEITPEDIAKQMQSILSQTDSTQNETEDNIENEPVFTLDENILQAWIENLPEPAPEQNEFLVAIEIEGDYIIACLRELSWYDAVYIDCFSHKMGSNLKPYFAGEKQKREKLAKAIRWIAEYPSEEVTYNTGKILTRVKPDVIDAIWYDYKKTTEISSEEADILYDSAIKYFREETQEGVPIHPLIIEVDFADRLGGWTRQETRNIPESEMARIKLIQLAKQHALGLSNIIQQTAEQETNGLPDLRNVMSKDMFPEEAFIKR